MPVANLWLPYRTAKEVWKASAQSAPDGAWRTVSNAPVEAWWFCWITALAVGRVGSTLDKNAQDADALQQSTAVVMVSDLLFVAGAVFAIFFVRKLTRMQQVTVPQEPASLA